MGLSRQLADRIASDEIIVAPGCHDALGARLIARAGFSAVYMSGNATTASLIGQPDIGLLGMSEMVGRAGQIVGSVDIPLICDADTGYGGVHNVGRTVQAYERAGVAAVHIEDQAFPKRCGAMEGLRLVSRNEAEKRLRAALQARQDPDFLIVARTDARAAESLDEAWYRGRMFADAGADLVYIEGLRSRQEIEATARRFQGIPLFFDAFEGWPWTLIPARELAQMGFRIVIFPLTATLLFARAMQSFLDILREDGTTNRLASQIMTLGAYEEILGLDEMTKLEDELDK